MDYIISSVVLLSLDTMYRKLTMPLMENVVETVQGTPLKVKTFPLILVYMMLFFTFYTFVLREKRSPKGAFILGLCIYSILNLTNLTILTDWCPLLTVMDSLWGGTLFYLTRAMGRAL